MTLCEPNGRFGAQGAGYHGGNMSEGVSPSPGGTRPGFSVNTHNLLGGLIVAVIALFMLGFAFYVPNTVIPRFMLAGLAVIGIAAAVGLVPVHAPRDFYGGIALVLLPAFALVASAELPGQRGFAFGPGTAPRLCSFMISILGSSEMRWIESTIAGALMTLFCVLLFVYLLNLPFQLWPRFY